MDASYLQFCDSDAQRKVLSARIDTGSNVKAAKALGMNRRSVDRAIAKIVENAERRNYSPQHNLIHPIPPTQQLSGNSLLYKRGEAEPLLYWVKTSKADQDKAEAMRIVAEELGATLPRYSPVTGPSHTQHDLLTLYGITDYHLGMLAWGEETGADWDVDIAERLLIDWFATAVHVTPKAETAILCNLGDFLHADGLDALTPASKHLLDVDTRFQRVVRIAIRCIRRIIALLLAKHGRVHIIMADANHDPVSGIWLREWLHSVYQDEPRVTVDNGADTYYFYEFGSNLLAFHHGHKRGPKDLGPVLVAKNREAYGRTRHHYAFTGHLHHLVEHESALWVTRQWRTLAAPDAYASRHGLMSGRDAEAITFHREHGKVSSVTISPDMIRWKK